MQLANPFSNETRILYLYEYKCILCSSNGTSRGGLELNHIFGRVSASPYNASLLCHECHSHVGHNREEHKELFELNAKFLAEIGYQWNYYDKQFIDDYVMPLYPEIKSI